MTRNTLRSTMIHVVTRYDIEESKKKGYNCYALGQYMNRVDDVCDAMERGVRLCDALQVNFNDRLLHRLEHATSVDA